ncbi:hypothetical protein K488DRAFT_73669, partial [Vararia minispora EC-137]
MSAADIHTTVVLLSSDDQPFGPPATHSRNQSFLSATTLGTQASLQNEPLLALVDAPAYHDMLARQPLHPVTEHVAWQTDDAAPREKQGYWTRAARKRLRWRRAAAAGSASVVGAGSAFPAVWAVYTAVRYLVAFALYPDRTRRAVSLALAISTLASLALLLALSSPRPRAPSLFPSRLAAPRLLASSFLFAPACTNLALVIAWRNAHDPQLSLSGRCHWDLDASWVGVGGQCDAGPAWGVWLAAALARLCSTATALTAYLVASHLYDAARARTHEGKSAAAEIAAAQPAPTTVPFHDTQHNTAPALWDRRMRGGERASRSTSSTARGAPSDDASSTPDVELALSTDGLAAADFQSFADRFRTL